MSIITLEIGHGPFRDRNGVTGFERGASGNGTTEYDEVLAQADIVRGDLQRLGHDVRLLDPVETLTVIGQQSWGSDIMVSLHLNAFNRAVQGTETFIHRAGTANDMGLAVCIQREVLRALGFQDRGVKRNGLAVLGSVPPSVGACCLTEPFFIDAVPNAKATRELTVKSAEAIAIGIDRYLRG